MPVPRPAKKIEWPAGLLRASAQPYPPKTVLFREDDPASAVFGIDSGAVKLTASADDREVIVGLRQAGWVVGAAAATIASPHPVTAVTMVPSILRRIDVKTFTHLIAHDPAAGRWIRRMHAREVCEQARRIALLRRDPFRRMLWLVRELMSAGSVVVRPQGWTFEPMLTRSEMGQMVALSAEHVSRILAAMESRGVLKRDRGWFVVPMGSVLSGTARGQASRLA